MREVTGRPEAGKAKVSKLFLRLERQMLFEQVVVVDGMMMTDVSKFGVA